MHKQSHTACHYPPERRADAGDDDPAKRHQEGNQCGFPVSLVPQGTGKPCSNGSQESQSGDGYDEFAAVMALKLSAKAPNGASTSVATPVSVMRRDTGSW